MILDFIISRIERLVPTKRLGLREGFETTYGMTLVDSSECFELASAEPLAVGRLGQGAIRMLFVSLHNAVNRA